jgi:hypothetical protein
MPFAFPSDSAFGFAGIPTNHASSPSRCSSAVMDFCLRRLMPCLIRQGEQRDPQVLLTILDFPLVPSYCFGVRVEVQDELLFVSSSWAKNEAKGPHCRGTSSLIIRLLFSKWNTGGVNLYFEFGRVASILVSVW